MVTPRIIHGNDSSKGETTGTGVTTKGPEPAIETAVDFLAFVNVRRPAAAGIRPGSGSANYAGAGSSAPRGRWHLEILLKPGGPATVLVL
jgi:hypothetical protein